MKDTGGYRFVLGKYISVWYRDDEFHMMSIYGGKGKGKTTYSCKVGVDVLSHGQWSKDDWDIVWERLVFPPTEFIDKLNSIKEGERLEFLIWDDAGLWLNALDWHDPFVQAVQKYLNVARTDMACLLMTTPNINQVFGRIWETESDEIYKVHIRKDMKIGRGSKKQLADGTWKDYKYREARIYHQFILPDGKISVPNKPDVDRFSALMPDDFYKRYKPYRERYAYIAKQLIRYSLKRRVEKAKKEGRVIPSMMALDLANEGKEEKAEKEGRATDDLKLREFIEEAGVDV